jgi:hypothetical protein
LNDGNTPNGQSGLHRRLQNHHFSDIAVIRYEKGRPFVGSCREKNHDNYSTLTRLAVPRRSGT